MKQIKWLFEDIRDTEDLFNFIFGTLLLLGGAACVVLLWRVAISGWATK